MNAIETVGLSKTYGETKALDGLDLTMPEGSILGVLGPNGAGKTTTVKILTTLTKPTAGKAFVQGIDVSANPSRVRARIGLTGQYAAVDERLTGKENLEYVGLLFHMSKRDSRTRAAELLERFDLVEASNRVVKGYSGGMRRRLDIAMSLIARPSVLFLDEPTTGLDPRSRLAMWGLIEQLGQEGTTTFLTTQYLDEAEALADSIAVIDRGQVIAEGTADELKDRIGGDRLVVTIAAVANLEKAKSALAPLATGPIEISDNAPELLVPIHPGHRVVPNAIRALDECRCDVIDVELRRPSLDDVFLTITGSSTESADLPSGNMS
ncbi:MAG: ATP-binding cassette domain-containing protein [Acidimicrobiales bacterium]